MSGHKLQAGKPTLVVQPPASQYARPVKDGGPAASVLEDLLAVCLHPAVGVQVVGVGVGGHRHAGISEQFSAHLSLAPGYGTAA